MLAQTTTTSTTVQAPDRELRRAIQLAVLFAAIKLTIHIASTLWQRHIGMGYFRDEFYYLMCGRHLAWGYVDHGPIVALQARLGETLFGHSLLGIRMLSAAAGAMRVALTGLLCLSLGGRRSAQGMAMLAVISVPLYLGTDGYLSMNSFESMFWMTCLLALIMLLRSRSATLWWTIFGVAAGIGLLNKPSMTFFLAAIGVALLCTPQRRVLFTRQAAVGIALMVFIASPNLVWQMHNHWPTLEFLHNGRVEDKNIALNPLAFLANQVFVLGPWTAFLYIPGLVYVLRRRNLRWLGLTYLIFLALMMSLGAKDYYVAPIYPVLFAAGGLAWEQRAKRNVRVRQQRILAFPVAAATCTLLAIATFPTHTPVLTAPQYLQYARTLHLPSIDTEHDHAILPQFFADRYGWQENYNAIRKAVDELSAEDRARVGIYTGNYGEAASLEWLSSKDSHAGPLPPVISEHNNYALWGTRGLNDDVLIIDRAITADRLREFYDTVEVVGHVRHPLSMPYEQHDIFLVRNRKVPLSQDWVENHHYL